MLQKHRKFTTVRSFFEISKLSKTIEIIHMNSKNSINFFEMKKNNNNSLSDYLLNHSFPISYQRFIYKINVIDFFSDFRFIAKY